MVPHRFLSVFLMFFECVLLDCSQGFFTRSRMFNVFRGDVCFWLQRYETTRIYTYRTQWNTDFMSILSHGCHAKCISAIFLLKSLFSLTPATGNDACVVDT